MRSSVMCIAVMLGLVTLAGCSPSFHGTLNEGSGPPVPEHGQPVVTGLSPATVAAGGPSFTVTVTGRNFAQGDTVNWDSFSLNSTFVSPTEMTALVPNQMIYHATTGTIIVQPPAPYSINFGAEFTVTDPPPPGTAGFTLSTVNVLANDMVWDPHSQQIYLSVAGTDPAKPNSITALNPVTGQFGVSVKASSGADRLGVSSDGSWLYAGIDKDGSVLRFALPVLASDITIPLGGGSPLQLYHAVALEPAPASPNTIAVSRATSLGAAGGVVVYDQSTPRTTTVSSIPNTFGPLLSLTWNASDSDIYGALNSIYADTVFVMPVNASGIQLSQSVQLNAGSQAITLGGIHSSALTGYVYSEDGQVFDPSTNSVVNRLPLAALDGGFAYSTPLLTLDDNLGMAWIVGHPGL